MACKMSIIAWPSQKDDEFSSRYYSEQSLNKILKCRHAEHSDLPRLEDLIRPTTYEIFGDIKLGQLYETSCLSVVQYNEKHEVVSGICLCNYPNVASVPPSDWLAWLKTIYGIPFATERNTLFVHLLVWDERYADQFFKDLLIALFDITIDYEYVIFVIPPRVTPEGMFEQEMTKVLSKDISEQVAVQFLYLSTRHEFHQKLKIRRAVEEDNDDLIPIIDGETTRLKELYGEYYISEMIRYPDECRQLIVGEDTDGSIMGVICLNSTIDVDLLNENFELAPYNGFRKLRENDEAQNNAAKVSNELLRGSQEYFQHLNESLNDDTSGVNEVPGNIHIFKDNGRHIVSAVRDGKTMQSPLIDNVFPRPINCNEINAFVLEIFAMRKGMRPQWPRDFLAAAFHCFPDLEYCAIFLPFSHPSFQFLRHFVRVPLRSNKDFPMTLYVLHRAILLGEIECRRAEVRDREAAEELLLAIPKKHEILIDFDLAMDPSQLNLDCLVFECNGTMIGLVILCAEEEITFIRSHYHIEDYISMHSIPQDGYGRLLHFILMPIFSVYHRFFFREIARLSEVTVIFYRLYQENTSNHMHPLVSCLNDLTPVKPRRQAEYRFSNILENMCNCENNVIDEKNNYDDMFSLFMMTPRLGMISPIIIDTKIVVVGASDCGIACAEYLALRSTQHYMQFTNITLVSPHGLPFDNKRSHREICLLPFRGKYCQEYRRCVAARTWINIIYGTMIAINRKEKYVTLVDHENLTYDYLVLTCGLQYQKSIFQEEAKTQKTEITMDSQIPWNCLTINDDTEASSCLKKVQIITKDLKQEKMILFYGHNIDCYCALRGLIEFGIKPAWITLIEPSLDPCELQKNAFFHHCQVDEAVKNAVIRSGIKVLSEWNMIDWALITENEKFLIESVTIEKKGERKTLMCDVLFNLSKKKINWKTFLAFCLADLVFDDLLVIDLECRTNDPFIFAAGTVTKYSRKFYAESWQHNYYNSVEVGERLAQILRKVIDTHRNNEQVPKLSKKEKVYLIYPEFRVPVTIACVLPGAYHYLRVRKPGKRVLRSTAITQNSRGEVYVTGSCTSEIGYFRIRLNLYDSVETVTCVSKKIFEVQNMIALYGKHESMLNELKLRFRNSYITDFYAYFREPWAAAIFYDRFQCLRVENRAILLSRTDIHDDFLINDCMRTLIKSKWEAISEEDRHYIASRYAGSIYYQKLQNNLMKFLEFYENDLPMFCTPSKQRQMYMDIEESPLYFEQ